MPTHLVLFVFLFLHFTVLSQPEKVRAKIITGLVGAQIDGDRLAGYNKPGLIAGMAMELPLSKKFALQPEIMYAQKGARSGSNGAYYAIVRLSYLDLVGIANWYVTSRFVLQTGFGYGVLFRAKADYGGGFTDVGSYFNTSDKYWALGTEFRFTPKTSVNLRYGYSLVTIRPGAYWYNNTLSFTLRFTLGDSK